MVFAVAYRYSRMELDSERFVNFRLYLYVTNVTGGILSTSSIHHIRNWSINEPAQSIENLTTQTTTTNNQQTFMLFELSVDTQVSCCSYASDVEARKSDWDSCNIGRCFHHASLSPTTKASAWLFLRLELHYSTTHYSGCETMYHQSSKHIS